MTKTNSPVSVAALYRFVELSDYADLKMPLLEQMQQRGIFGTLLLAREGLNGTVAGMPGKVAELIAWLQTADLWQGRLAGLDVKLAQAESMPFARCKVKLKKEIVTMGVADIDPNKSVGTYVKPQDWNELISDPDVLTIDTRNDYEVKIGTFSGAINPHTSTFREFPDYAQREIDPQKHKKIAMFCTGGIRCEKSTAYMKSLGFNEVYHLQGGILKYLEEVPSENSLWQGECFVFDDRVAVDHNLEAGSYSQCHACRMPLNADEMQHQDYVPGESCPHCCEKTTPEQRKRFRERQKQIDLARERGEKHIGHNIDTIREERQAQKIAVKDKQRGSH